MFTNSDSNKPHILRNGPLSHKMCQVPQKDKAMLCLEVPQHGVTLIILS